MVSDTALISQKLVADGLAEDLNGNITAAEKAQDLAVRALLEDKLYFYQVRRLSSSLLPILPTSLILSSNGTASSLACTKADCNGGPD